MTIRLSPSFNTIRIQHADFELYTDGDLAPIHLDSFDCGDRWIKLWIAITENHDEKIARLLCAKSLVIVAQHPAVKGDVIRRSLESPQLVRRVIGSTAGPNVVREELWFAETGAEIPTDSTDVRLNSAIQSALYNLRSPING